LTVLLDCRLTKHEGRSAFHKNTEILSELREIKKDKISEKNLEMKT